MNLHRALGVDIMTGLTREQRNSVLQAKREIKEIMQKCGRKGLSAYKELHKILKPLNSYTLSQGKYRGWHGFDFDYKMVCSAIIYNEQTQEIKLWDTCDVFLDEFIKGSNKIMNNYNWS